MRAQGTRFDNGTGAPIGGGGSAGNAQFFEYVATGAEGVNFAIVLPAARASASYGVAITGETVGDTFSYSVSAKTTTQFTCRTSAQLVAGTKLMVLVEDLR